MKALFYDLEIAKCIPQKQRRGEPPPVLDPSLEYCDGWGDHYGMGISTLCAYQGWDGAARVFDEDTIEDFHAAAEEAEVLVSYNGIHFDNRVIDAHSSDGLGVDPRKCYDLRVALLEVRPDLRFQKGYNLNSICKRTLGLEKSGDGSLAPVLWQRGRIAAVVDYCLHDVMMVARLFTHVDQGRPIVGVEGDGPIILPRFRGVR